MFPPSTHRPPGPDRRAFTLVELLVSMTVLTLLVLAVSQIVRGTAAITTGNRQNLDADAQARLVFDRMGTDLARMLKRPDVDYLFSPQVGNDKFFFYSEAPAYFDSTAASTAPPPTPNASPSAQSPLALIGYRVDVSMPKTPTLLRLGKGLTWEGNSASAPVATPAPGATVAPMAPGAIVFLSPSSTPSAATTPAPDVASTLAGHWPTTVGTAGAKYDDGVDASYHVIADQVCRLEICFLLKPLPATANNAALPAIYSVTPYRPGVPLHGAPNGLQDVRAVVVAIAVLDRSSRQITPDLSRMTTALRDIATTDLTASPPALMAKVWQDEIDQGKLAADARIPAAAAQQVRIYQRHFYLDTN